MAEYFKLRIARWFTATDGMGLELEAAYLRIIGAINLYDQPIRDNARVLAGLWRCNERKANRLRQELVDAGKIWIEDNCIYNELAMEDVSIRRQLRVERQSTGSRGGIESGKARRKLLKNNETYEALGLTREEKRREEKKESPLPPKGGGRKKPIEGFEEWYETYPRKIARGAAVRAFAKAMSKTDLSTLIAATKKYVSVMAGKEREFIAHPATWLNGERWLDADATGYGQSGLNGEDAARRKVDIAKDWLSRHDDIPTWMDKMDTAEMLIAEGYDYDKLRKAGFSLPPRGNVVEIRGIVKDLAGIKMVSSDPV